MRYHRQQNTRQASGVPSPIEPFIRWTRKAARREIQIATIVAAVLCNPLIAQGFSQTPSEATSNDQTGNTSGRSETQGTPIRLTKKESTLSAVLLEISKAAKQPVVFNDKDPVFARRINVQIDEPNVLSAFAVALKGTGFTASLGPDGRTVIVSASKGDKVTTQKNEGTIVGIVLDSTTKKPIAGATVVIRGTKMAATTRDDGRFRFTNVPTGTRALVVRLLGYHTRTIDITVADGSTAQTTVVLQQSSTSLTEVVTTAMGKQRRIDISNDVVTIDADKMMQAAPIRNATDMLVAAQVPGMIITKSSGDPSAPTRIRLGGPGSISQNNDPVLIIDGIWVKSSFSTPDIERGLSKVKPIDGDRPQQYLAGGSAYLPSRLDDIDPATIETIEVVRGPAAATLYGPDAANGVIRITTKRGRSGPTRWDIRAARNVGSPVGNKPLEYTAFGRRSTSSEPFECALFNLASGICAEQDSLVTYDPNDPYLRGEGNTFTNDLSLTVSGGTNALLYSVTGSMQDLTGPKRFSGVERVRLRQLGIPFTSKLQYPSQIRNRGLSARIGLTPRQELDISLDFTGSQRNTRSNTVNITIPGNEPILMPRDTVRTLQRAYTDPSQSNAAIARGMVSLAANWKPRPWMTANMSLGVDREYTEEKFEESKLVCGGGLACAIVGQKEGNAPSQNSVYSARIQSSFLPNLGWASRFIAVRPGISFDLRKDVRSNSAIVIYTPVEGLRQTSVGDPAALTTALAGLSVNAYITLFDRISFDPGFRRDFASSRAIRNAAKSYPRFGTSWLVSDESFFPKTQFITLLRLRGALGYAAVQPDISAIKGGYLGGSTIVNGQQVQIVRLVQIGNSELEPERSFEVETGVDADLFGERITLSLTYSNKRNINTLIDRPLAMSAGVMTTRQENVAETRNQSTTLQLMTHPVDLPTVSLRLGANIGIFNNKVQRLGRGVSPFGLYEQRYIAGYPLGGIWAQPFLGFRDLNQNGVVDYDNNEIVLGDTMIYVGTNIPRYTIGYNVEVGLFRRVTFSSMFDYQGKIMQTRSTSSMGQRGLWDPQAPFAEQISALLQYMGRIPASDYQGLSVLRWQSASLTFDVPTSWLRTLRARSAQLSLQGSNLSLWTQYRGRDPGVNSTPIGERTTDNGNELGLPRSYVVQLRLGY